MCVCVCVCMCVCVCVCICVNVCAVVAFYSNVANLYSSYL